MNLTLLGLYQHGSSSPIIPGLDASGDQPVVNVSTPIDLSNDFLLLQAKLGPVFNISPKWKERLFCGVNTGVFSTSGSQGGLDGTNYFIGGLCELQAKPKPKER